MRVINLAFQVEKFFIGGDRIDAGGVRDFMAKGEFLLAEGGCVYVEARGPRCYLGLLSVDPSKQGAGVGRCLMRAAEDRARELGCEAMDLRVVNLREELPAFYHHMGYVENGVQEFPPEVPTLLPCHFILMAKHLA